MRNGNNRGKRDFNRSRDNDSKRSGDKPKRFSKEGGKPFKKRGSSYGGDEERGERPQWKDKKPYREKRSDDSSGDRKPYSEDKKYIRGGDRPERGERSSFKKEGFNKERSNFKRRREDGGDKPYREKRSGDSYGDRKPYRGDKKYGNDHNERSDKPYWKKDGHDKERSDFSSKRDDSRFSSEKKYEKRDREEGDDSSEKKYYSKDKESFGDKRKNSRYGDERAPRKKKGYEGRRRKSDSFAPSEDGLTRLNKYLSNAGICSRREADDLITSGVVSVNGKVITEMGFKVSPTDDVKYNGESLRKEKMVYVLLNKPKDFITTLEDPRGRRTVLELVKKAGRERIYPVGRLDRNTTGVLLMTNDGELTARLTHPRYGVKKMYHVTLDKNFKVTDFDALAAGVTLEDGFIKPDVLSFVNDGADKREVGVEIHSGKNRIVRRMFAHLGYEVIKLDRVFFAGLTKKDVPRGRWRFLSEKEVAFLKMIPKNQ